jgi:hypothetical protein
MFRGCFRGLPAGRIASRRREERRRGREGIRPFRPSEERGLERGEEPSDN